MKKYNIHDLVGKYCMTLEDGQTVYQLIHPELIADHPVEVDFAGVDFFASPFFNFAIGQLLRDVKPETLNRLLTLSNLNPVGRQVLKKVIENSKRYYSDEPTRKAVDTVVSEQAHSL